MNIKKIVALFISLVLVFSVCVVNVSAVESKGDLKCGMGTVQQYASDNNVDTTVSLSENVVERSIDYEGICDLIADGASRFAVSIDVTDFGIPVDNEDYLKEVFGIIYNMLWSQRPELFNLSNKYRYNYYSDGIMANFIYVYNCTEEEYQVMYREFENVVNDITNDLKGDNLSDVQKALILHDRLAIMCEYATDRLNSNTLTYKEHSAYGALVEGLAVCDGYTKAYSYLLDMVGIESKRCPSDEMNHAWNIVYIDGKAYHVDVTWDDPVPTGGWQKPQDYVRHTNFLLSTNALHNNTEDDKDVGCHTAEDFDHEPDDTTYDHYFWRDCTHETLLIGSGLYHLNGAGALCEYDSHDALADAGLGDIDGDEKINAMDISHCRRFLTEKVTPQEKEFTACDLTKDGEISVSDLVRYKKILLYME